jgi:hypothetical protein
MSLLLATLFVIYNRPFHHLTPVLMVRSKTRQVSVVGPNYIQVLQGTLLNKQVALVLCGESHEDAIDVTRKGGIFEAKEGWIELEIKQALALALDTWSNECSCSCRILDRTKKSLPVEKTKEWATKRLKNADVYEGGRVVLVWVKDEPETKTQKGKGYLLEFLSQEDMDGDDSDDDDDDVKEDWILLNETNPNLRADHVPAVLYDWAQHIQTDKMPVLVSRYRTFEWRDLDSEAHALNKRRLTEEEISTSELDAIIRKRKQDLGIHNISTWDDWFAQVQVQVRTNNNTNDTNDTDTNVALHLVLEASVPPWELELHRPKANDMERLVLPPAADCIRCVAEDEEGSSEDDYDPSSDGVGSYSDFCYRRFMEEMLAEPSNKQGSTGIENSNSSTWLHCVDSRDLGCQAACHSVSVKEKWKNLLLPDEIQTLFNDDKKAFKFQPLEPDSTKEFVKFVPEGRMNPERLELENMQSKGLLTVDDEDGDGDDDDDDEAEFSFPSFEGFFGQSADSLYYSPHVKLSYSPLLAKCVGSLSNWETLFTNLFLGGTISDALAALDLDQNRDHIYVRSPLLKSWNPDTSSYEYRHRDDGEEYISYPFFPYIFHLAARGSSPPRTWSSQLFARLCTHDGNPILRQDAMNRKDIAIAARDWTLESIRRHSKDPKGSDDPHCGGEWFEAFLRANHRDIYDDIDLSDSAVLLRKNYMKSESDGRKHNIGKIQIPSCQDGFDEIMDRFGMELALRSDEIVTPRVEVMAKILIDIWMMNLIDFSTVLKIAEVVSDTKSESENVVVVCYMGSAHTRAVADFYVNRMGFKKKAFLGKLEWDDGKPRTIKLPSYLWNISELFK